MLTVPYKKSNNKELKGFVKGLVNIATTTNRK
jgi:hypothetical protein